MKKNIYNNMTNTIAVSRPTNDSIKSIVCNSSCDELGPVDPLDKNLLGPRPKREKVRLQIRDYILHMLGAPSIEIELDEQNIDFCIDQAMKIFEDYAPAEYFSYYVFDAIPGKSIYELPPDVGIVKNVHYRKVGEFSFSANDIGGAIPIEYFYPGGSYASIMGGLVDPVQPIWGRMGEWVLYKQYERMYSRVSSNIGGWEWLGDTRHIKLYPVPLKNSRVTVNYMQRMKDWGEVTQALQEGALSYAKEILGRIRSKYASLPGAGGGIQLDGQTLLAEAKQERQEWFDNLIVKFGDILLITMD